MDYEKIILVTRKTRLEGLVERFNTASQAKFYLEHSGGNFDLYRQEHDTYRAAVDRLRKSLQLLPKFQEIERGFLPNFLFSESDIVVTAGIDGLVVNTAKYLDGQPLIAVNPDPAHIDGILLPFTVEQAPQAVHNVLKNTVKVRKISMAEARLNDSQALLAFNDLFIGVRGHISARYRIGINRQEEHQSSSGIIVSTGVGSTGWLSSIFNMTNGVLQGFTRTGDRKVEAMSLRLDWEADKLVFVVREPFVSKTSQAGITCGYVSNQTPLVLHSEMAEGGIIFSDGVEADFLAFNAGAVATIGVSEKKTQLVVGG